MPELIAADGSIRAYDFREFSEQTSPPPPYGNHGSDPVVTQDGRMGYACATSETRLNTQTLCDPPVYVS